MLCRWTGAGVIGICLLMFGMTAAVDPGLVTKQNEVYHQSLYPYDDVTNTQKDCQTCNIVRPARAKHCNVCKGYVALRYGFCWKTWPGNYIFCKRLCPSSTPLAVLQVYCKV